jgi:nitrogen fixation/metabolism regulation signal transduction histidine kinase
MFKNSLTFAWFGLIACYAAGYVLLFRELHVGGRFDWILLPGALGFLFWIYVGIRLFFLRRGLTSFANNIIAGEYETGIELNRLQRDETAALARLINRVADRLRLYDALRAEKVAINTRAREVMFEETSSAVILADVDEQLFHFNSAARDLFAVDQEEMTFASIEKRPENAVFDEFFRDTIEREKVPREADFEITIPIRASTKGTHALIVPIKDKEEKVRLALIFLR